MIKMKIREISSPVSAPIFSAIDDKIGIGGFKRNTKQQLQHQIIQQHSPHIINKQIVGMSPAYEVPSTPLHNTPSPFMNDHLIANSPQNVMPPPPSYTTAMKQHQQHIKQQQQQIIYQVLILITYFLF